MTRLLTRPTRRPPARPRKKPDIDHARGMRISTELTSWHYQAWGTTAMQITPKEVIKVLNAAGVKFVLMGAHSMAGWLKGDVRSTIDVDVLIRKQHHKKAVQAICDAFPHLKVEDENVVTRFRDPELNVIVLDLMKPMHDIHVAVFNHTVRVGKTHEIPDLEMALAAKFAAMTSANREARKKMLDGGDFITIAQFNSQKIDRDKLRALGELVFPQGGDTVISLLDDALAGRILKL